MVKVENEEICCVARRARPFGGGSENIDAVSKRGGRELDIPVCEGVGWLWPEPSACRFLGSFWEDMRGVEF